jgi:hypothetical protein
MRKIEHFVCEICGTEYRDRLAAVSCEKCHKTPVAIIKSRYVSKSQNGAGYPVTIEIQMSDGTFQTYKR